MTKQQHNDKSGVWTDFKISLQFLIDETPIGTMPRQLLDGTIAIVKHFQKEGIGNVKVLVVRSEYKHNLRTACVFAQQRDCLVINNDPKEKPKHPEIALCENTKWVLNRVLAARHFSSHFDRSGEVCGKATWQEPVITI